MDQKKHLTFLCGSVALLVLSLFVNISTINHTLLIDCADAGNFTRPGGLFTKDAAIRLTEAFITLANENYTSFEIVIDKITYVNSLINE
jgi:hypothetical protein